MNSTDYLLGTRPTWVEVLKSTRDRLEMSVRAQKPSGRQGRVYLLNIARDSIDRISVKESAKQKILPPSCVERHINPSGTFCVFWESTKPIQTVDSARSWWRSLGSYLDNQDFAHKRREWPIKAGLSHGDAANIQFKMEALKLPEGWLEEIQYGMFRQRGWFSGTLPTLKKNSRELINIRSPCPRLCKRKHVPLRKKSCETPNCVEGCQRQHLPMLRADCGHRRLITDLIILEEKRRLLEAELISDIKKDGGTCCGTMNRCPLR